MIQRRKTKSNHLIAAYLYVKVRKENGRSDVTPSSDALYVGGRGVDVMGWRVAALQAASASATLLLSQVCNVRILNFTSTCSRSENS